MLFFDPGAKNAFLLDGLNYGMAWMQNQNQQKILNNLNLVSKTPEHNGNLFIPGVRFTTLNYFYLAILFCTLLL